MTNDLQQAYDRAMAHNSMLREALGELTKAYWHNTVVKAHEALNATEADATAWLKQRDAKWLSNQETAVQLWSNAEQQLATAIAERDALREALGWAFKYLKDGLRGDVYLAELIDGATKEEAMVKGGNSHCAKALAQKADA